MGWDLLKVALKGRTIRLRNMAINALRDWGKPAWPPDALAEIEAAERREPDTKVRARFRALLDGTLRDLDKRNEEGPVDADTTL
jgi:hypothetical protein